MTTVLVALAVAGVLLVLASVRPIPAQHRLVVSRRGEPVRVAGPGLAMVVPLLESSRQVDTSTRHAWEGVSARTADGATARLQVEYALRVTDPVVAPVDVDAQVADAVQGRLRHAIADTRAGDLPDSGFDPGWEPGSFVPGVAVEHVAVTSSDVAVTPELRRLLGPARSAAWT
jgi:regulator of protease activity HflC (stomatin/prohibitin superfamily)